MKIAVTGGTGFIGGHLTDYLTQAGHEVVLISRRAAEQGGSSVRQVTWGELERSVDSLQDVDAIVNLAGESINQRWTPEAKRRILQSRLHAADAIARLAEKLDRRPQVLVNASGMSIYGTSETETFDEDNPSRITDYLAGVVEQWEAAVDRIAIPRIVKLRVGVVLGTDGGAFPKMALPYKLGAGGRIGSGRQVLSWIHIDDIVRLIDWCIRNESVVGPVNATAPNPATNDQFGRTLGSVIGRPHYMPVPAVMFKLLFGELSVLLLEGQRVIPKRALEQGFVFRYPELKQAIRALYDKDR